MDWMIKEANKIELHLNNLNREDGVCLSWPWKSLVHTLKGHRRISYSIASPHVATSPHWPFQDIVWPWPVPCFLLPISCHFFHSLPLFSFHVLLSHPTILLYLHWSPISPLRAFVRAHSSILSSYHFPTSQAVTCPPLLLLATWPSPTPDHPYRFNRALPWLTCSLYLWLFSHMQPTHRPLKHWYSYKSTWHYNSKTPIRDKFHSKFYFSSDVNDIILECALVFSKMFYCQIPS